MKTKITVFKKLFLTLVVGAAVFGSSARAESTAFSYQGKLEDGGRPVTGIYELTFGLHGVAESGTALASLPPMLTPVTNGLFTVMLDFGAMPFDGSARWLQVNVRTNGATYGAVPLLPRTSLGSAPYATYAAKAGSVANGSAVKSLNSLKDDLTLAAGNNVTLSTSGNTITVASTGGAFTLNGTVAYYNGGKVGIGTSTPLASLDVLGNWDGEQGALNLRGTKPTLRLTGDAVSGNQSWLMHLSSQGGGNLEFYRRTGPGSWAWTMMLQTNSDVAFSPTTKLSFGNQVRQMLNLWSDEYALGVQAGTLYQRTWGAFAWHKFGQHSDAYADPGAGGRTLMTLDDNFLMVRGGGGEKAYLGGDGAGGDIQIGSLNAAINNVVAYNAANGTLMDFVARNITAASDFHTASGDHGMGYRGSYAGSYIDGPVIYGYNAGGLGTSVPDDLTLTWDWHGNVWVKNNLNACNLTVRGGCDVAEPFQMSTGDIPKGAVVVIDPANPGHLKMSHEAYDSRVAGIVSGANGINAGIALHQEGLIEGGQNVALTGRVYVQADASYGAIKPGDLLTTSDTPGHAMKVTEHSRAQGAILGKAMTALDEGNGMVLVLVTLQ